MSVNSEVRVTAGDKVNASKNTVKVSDKGEAEYHMFLDVQQMGRVQNLKC